jgi:hypothetical protein
MNQNDPKGTNNFLSISFTLLSLVPNDNVPGVLPVCPGTDEVKRLSHNKSFYIQMPARIFLQMTRFHE